MNVRDSCQRWLFVSPILYLRVPKWARELILRTSSRALTFLRTSYDFFKSKLMHRVIPVFNTKLKDSILLHSISSCLAGLVATSEPLCSNFGSRLRLINFSCLRTRRRVEVTTNVAGECLESTCATMNPT
jgi:hypothetical protein